MSEPRAIDNLRLDLDKPIEAARRELEAAEAAAAGGKHVEVYIAMLKDYIQALMADRDGLPETDEQRKRRGAAIEGYRKRLPFESERPEKVDETFLEQISFASHEMGLSTAESAALRRDVQKRDGRGEPLLGVKWLTIVALEYHLKRMSYLEIADQLCQYDREGELCHGRGDPRNRHKNGSRPGKLDSCIENRCSVRFRQRVQGLKDFLENVCGFEFEITDRE